MSRLRSLFADTRPLQNPHFRRLWTANIVTMIGAQLSVVAVPAQIYQMTTSSAYVGLTGVFGLVPLIVFGLWGGALADAMDRRTLLLATTAGMIGTSALFWVQAALGLNNVWLVLVLFSIQQACFAVNQPTRAAVVPRLIASSQLPAANSLNMTVFQFGGIAGPLVGGALIPVIGLSWLYLADTLCLLATVWAVIKLPQLPPERDPDTGPPQMPGIRSVLEGFAYLRHHKVLLMSFVIDLIAMVFGMPRALFPQIANESFGGPLAGGLAFALLFAAIPAGAVAGGIFSGWVSRVQRQGLAVVVSILVWGVAMTGFGLSVLFADPMDPVPMLLLATATLALGGAADITSGALRQTMLQDAATDNVRGRLQGVFTVVVAGGPRVADVVHGSAAALVGTAAATTGGGIGVVVGALIAAIAVPVFVRYRVGITKV